jgi:hypothetical protein
MSTLSIIRARARQGMALPMALAAILVVGALIAGVVFASTQEYRVGRNTLGAQRALHGAEVGLSSVVSSWTAARTTSTRVGQTVTLTDTVINDAFVQRQFTKISPTVFWVNATAVAGGLGSDARALKRLNTIVRIQTPDFRIMGAVTSRGRTGLSGSTRVSGTDTVPAGWDCPPGGNKGAGVVVGDSAANVTGSGANCAGYACVNGDPKVKDSTALVNDTMSFTSFGGFSYDSLVTLANKVRTAGGTISTIGPQWNADGSCNVAHVDNWGDTSHVDGPRGCESYFPVVHLRGGGLTYLLNGNGGGQGILLVDGNLQVQGRFKWTGIVIVRGTFSIAGTGGGAGTKIIGAVAAMNRSAGTNGFSGNSSVTFSRCAVNQVTARLATAAPARYRAWADISF